MFLLGHWKNFDQLESELSMPEMLAILKALRDRQEREHRFAAAIQGIDYGDDTDSDKPKTGDDVIRNARAKARGVDPSDILSLQGRDAEEAGFGIGMGLGYEVI